MNKTAEQLLDLIAHDIVTMGRIKAVKEHVPTLIQWRNAFYIGESEMYVGDIKALDALVEDVVRVFHVDKNCIINTGRKRVYVMLRKIIIFIAHSYKFASLKDIAERLGGRDHTTAVHSNQSFRDLYQSNDELFLSFWNKYLREGKECFTNQLVIMIKENTFPLHAASITSSKDNKRGFTKYSNKSPMGIADELKQAV